MRLKSLIILLFLVLTTSSLFAQIGGTSTYDFLQLPVSSRSAALGGDFIAVRDGDLSLAAENPSFLDSSVSNHTALSYIPFFAGIKYGYASFAHTFDSIGHLKNVGTIALSIKYIDYGSFDYADLGGNEGGTFTAGEYLVQAGYGRPLMDSTFSGGANLKFIYSHLYQYYSSGLALDLAGSYVSHNRRFFLGLVIQNIGHQIKDYTAGDNEPLPFDVKLAFAKKLAHAPFRFGITAQHLQKWDLTYIDPADTETVNPLTGQAVTHSSIGGFADKLMRHLVPNLEVVLGKNFMIRFAYNYEMRKELELDASRGLVGFSGGFGIKIYKFQINYALAKYNLAGSSNTFTIGMALDEFSRHSKT
jgi:hypothetical protein